ncbi:MAG TPA: helix-turn-helix domain-containing protein [Pseudonocardia sp.]|nr:helix-turn-helix domain-containing protein [Pseudonocardia sp.]
MQRLEDIIETGIEVFHNRGYDSGSLDDVAAALDLRRASLCHYLRNKAQLLYLTSSTARSAWRSNGSTSWPTSPTRAISWRHSLPTRYAR